MWEQRRLAVENSKQRRKPFDFREEQIKKMRITGERDRDSKGLAYTWRESSLLIKKGKIVFSNGF